MSESGPNQISKKIFFIRKHRVMLDVDLAALYAVETKTLNRAVRRNKIRYHHAKFSLLNPKLFWLCLLTIILMLKRMIGNKL